MREELQVAVTLLGPQAAAAVKTRTQHVELALAHDYLTQRGGAERVALIMAQAFPQAPMFTTLYEPGGTFPDFASVDLRLSVLNTVSPIRGRHRLALPVLAEVVSHSKIDADVALVSSSGWAHGYPVTGRKVVYCHAPARWLYQTQTYLGAHAGTAGTATANWARPASAALALLSGHLRKWDARAARTADCYLANSTVTRDAIRQIYGIDAEILHPPPALSVDGPQEPVDGVEPGYLLCVSRLLPYKNVDVLIDAVVGHPEHRLIVVGQGPDRARLLKRAEPAGDRVRLFGSATDAQLRWLYSNSSALLAASFEDFGLSPLEAAAFGRPAAVLRAGGFLDTVVEGDTGVFFDRPDSEAISKALRMLEETPWAPAELQRHADTFGVPRFQQRLLEVVEQARRS